jgi:hypothetical protein
MSLKPNREPRKSPTKSPRTQERLAREAKILAADEQTRRDKASELITLSSGELLSMVVEEIIESDKIEKISSPIAQNVNITRASLYAGLAACALIRESQPGPVAEQ